MTNSISAFVSVYEMLYSHYPDYTPVNPDTINTWDFSECTLLHKYKNYSVEEIFGMKEFFDRLELFPNAYEVLKEISKKYELYIVSIGTLSNLQYKAEYIRHKLPFINNVILIYNKECKMNKAIVNCPENSIFLDDVVSNLDSVASRRKFIYGVEKPWNTESNQYKRLYNYIDVANEFLK